MKSIAVRTTFFLGVCAIVLSIIVAAGLSIGFVLNWLVPAIDLGVATLCGLVSIVMFVSVAKDFANYVEIRRVSNFQSSDDDDDELSLSEEQFESLAEQLSEAVMSQMAAKEQWGRPRPKARR